METNSLYALLGATVVLQIATLVTVRKHGAQGLAKTATVTTAQSHSDKDMIILDTCALIDGRIRDLVNAGFIKQRLGVPQRVVEELQYLADHGDAHKRSRARFGLDVVQALQESAPDQVLIIEGGDSSMAVDDVLVAFALEYKAALYTTDYNLNKVARIRGVQVLNVNELTHALRPIHLPGEKVTVKIVQKGESHAQGVGYLEDGTMVVVDGAAKRIGTQVTAQVERMLQTEAGRMVFAIAQGNGNSQQAQTSLRSRRRAN